MFNACGWCKVEAIDEMEGGKTRYGSHLCSYRTIDER